MQAWPMWFSSAIQFPCLCRMLGHGRASLTRGTRFRDSNDCTGALRVPVAPDFVILMTARARFAYPWHPIS